MAKGGSGTMDGATVGEGDWGGRYVDPQFEGPSWFEARAGMDKSPAVDGSRRGGLGRALGGALVGGLLGGIPGAIAGGLRGGMSGGQRGPGRLPGGYLNLRDYFNGGGPGMAGTRFEGSPFAGLLNAIGVHPRGYAERQQTIADKLATRDYDVADPTRRGSYISAAAAPSATGGLPMTEQYIPPQPVTVSAIQPVSSHQMMLNSNRLPIGSIQAISAPLPTVSRPDDPISRAYANNYLARAGEQVWEDAVGIPYYDPMAVPGQVAPQYSGVGMSTGQYAYPQVPASNADFARDQMFRVHQYVQDQFPFSYQQTPYQTPYVDPGYQPPVSP